MCVSLELERSTVLKRNQVEERNYRQQREDFVLFGSMYSIFTVPTVIVEMYLLSTIFTLHLKLFAFNLS